MPRKLLGSVLSLLFLTLIVGLLGGYFAERMVSNWQAKQGDDLALIAKAAETVRGNYVGAPKLGPRQLAYGAITGMVFSLGDYGHTRFLTPDALRKEQASQQGQFAGVGIEVQIRGGRVIVVAPLPNSPAMEAGLRAGEVILEVDGQDIAGITLSEATRKIGGAAGTPVTLTLFNPPTATSRTVSLVRRQFAVSSVNWVQVPGTKIAHLRISTFSKGTTDGVRTALAVIKEQGLQGLVLDLRDDPGGLLDEAIGVASLFQPTGDVLQERDAHGKIEKLAVKGNAVAADLPMIVLVNQFSASASEVVAGAFQDHKRARIIGDTTYGTGTVLAQFNLPDGSAILLATREWLTPLGRTIWQKGIEPDVALSLKPGDTPLFPQVERNMEPKAVRESGDAQLLAAVDALAQPPR